MKKFLVTSALEQTWPDEQQQIVFLGEWCKLFSEKSKWDNPNNTTAPYHWDDRDKFHRDFDYLQVLYEKILGQLSLKLNDIHLVNHSKSYWRIVIGPWLNYFIGIVFDRWFMLDEVIKSGAVTHCNVISQRYGDATPNDMAEFSKCWAQDSWNEAIYSELLYLLDDGNKVVIENLISEQQNVITTQTSFDSSSIRSKLLDLFSYSESNIFCKNVYVLEGLPKFQSLKIQLSLNQIPKLWRRKKTPQVPYDLKFRNWALEDESLGTSDFESILSKLLFNHIPRVYLEGYRAAIEAIKNYNWPKDPRVIMCMSSYYDDDLFKIWAAEKIQEGIPLIIGQHGGHYSIGLFSATEQHEVMAATKYLSWGWQAPWSDNIVPIGNLKHAEKKVKYDPNGMAILVCCSIPRYSYRLYSIPVAGQWLSYFEDQCDFFSALERRIQEKVLVRPANEDYGWSARRRWVDRFPKVKLDSSAKPMINLMAQTRLYIATYNATTFLESFLWNVPTIIFWNTQHWEISPTAVPYFDELQSVGVFHNSPFSAARQIELIWDDVDAWWWSKEVQTARRNFCQLYSKPIKNYRKTLSELLTGPL